jgi:hypothetical protein
MVHDRMTGRRIPQRHWRSYDNEPLPTGSEALGEPFSAFSSWYLRITCDRCGKDHMLSETDTAQRNMRIRDIIARMRHDGCGGRASPLDHRDDGARPATPKSHRLVTRRLASSAVARPVTSAPISCWKRRIAARVRGPKIPSTGPL